MKKIFTRMLSVVLVLVMVLCAVPVVRGGVVTNVSAVDEVFNSYGDNINKFKNATYSEKECLLFDIDKDDGDNNTQLSTIYHAYKEVIDNYDWGSYNYDYIVYDIDKNGTTELILISGNYEGDSYFKIYTFNGNKVVELGEIGAAHRWLYGINSINGMYCQYTRAGYEILEKIIIEDNQIKEEKIWDKYQDQGYTQLDNELVSYHFYDNLGLNSVKYAGSTKLHIGKTLDLSGKETDEMATWSSSDESIAKVSDNGFVSAIKKGTATITATTSSGKVTVNLSVCDNSSCEWKITKAGSDTQNGERSYVCSSCEATVASEQFKDNLRVTINNSNLSYIQGEKIILAVSDFKNTKEIKPENLSVKVSDSSIIKVTGIKDFSKMNDLKIELLNNCKVVILETKDVGSASISITNSETGHTRKIPIVVSQDKYENIRADKIKTYDYKCWFEKDKYNAAFDGLWISDFSCNEVNGGWNFSMNIYNENYSNAVLEVFNKEGKLIDVKIIDKFESLTKGLWKTAVAGWTVIEDIKDGDTLSFRADTTAKHTEIKNLYIPQDGCIRVTADSSISVSCAIVNAFDIAFTCWTFVSDANQFISGISKFDRDSAKALTKTALTKLMAQEEYLNFAKKFQDKFIEKLGYNLSLDMLINLSNSILTDANVMLFEGLNVDFNDIVNMAFGTGVSVAEGLFLKLSGPFGVALKSMFISQDISDWILEVNNAYKRISGKTPVGWMTPYKGTSSVLVLKNEDVTVNTNGNVPNETIMQSFRIARGNQYERAFLKIIDRPIEDYETYEIALYNDGSAVQPNGKVEVSIASPYRTATVYRQKADGSWEYIESRIKNGMVVFEVDHFCKFIIAKENLQKQPENPSENCSCACHKKGIANFFFKIILFFQKIFKKNRVCSCGAAHY